MFDTSQNDHRETSAAYWRVICRFGKFRVVSSRYDLQWIVQKVDQGPRGETWRAIRYFRTKTALLSFWEALHQAVPSESWPELECLPEDFFRFAQEAT